MKPAGRNLSHEAEKPGRTEPCRTVTKVYVSLSLTISSEIQKYMLDYIWTHRDKIIRKVKIDNKMCLNIYTSKC